MDMLKTEKKWQQIWEETKAHTFKQDDKKDKHYVLEMFSYPSGAKLHAGHWYNYGPSDSYARYKKMKGFNVFQPMGFDAFGLPAENYAIKTGIHPKDSTDANIATMEEQLKNIGAMFDWDAEVVTCKEDYYKWTQWMFLKLYENGLAYRKNAPVNWCPSCQTVLANEQVLAEGDCERCGTQVVKKNLTQWFFKITEYAEELLQGLEGLDWPEKTKLMQKHWIGKSEGGEVAFTLEDGSIEKVFTTRADTLFGVSYMVIAPEHPRVMAITTDAQKEAVQAYIDNAAKSSEIDRMSTTREKTGVFTGTYAKNPVNGDKVPVFVADYVLASYGTGVVMGVAAHDDRDFVFAKKLGLEIVRVVSDGKGDKEECYTDYGTLVNSGKYTGMTSEEAIDAILADLEKEGMGGKKINYRLRDWLVSRQRYWGAPIPMIHCDKCGTVPEKFENLPVELPYDVEFAPDGKSPLAKSEAFYKTTCPVCGGEAVRDCDTLDTFVCSSWYYLRYCDNKNADMPFDPAIVNKMMPVDKYIGGAEHACMHLLYARFFTKALRDMGYLTFDEPFKSLVHQGTILGPDGNKMSKSKGNVISPDSYVSEYGSDVFRLYLMFGFSYIEGGPWNDDGIKSVLRFVERVERLCEMSGKIQTTQISKEADEELEFVLNSTIKRVDEDMNKFSFNTCVARMMELTNAMYKYEQGGKINGELFKQSAKTLILLLAPFTPHFAEEINEIMGGEKSVFEMDYPTFDASKLQKSSVEILVQINSKPKHKMMVSSNATQEDLQAEIMEIPAIKEAVAGKNIVKIIFVKGKLFNIIAK